MSAVFIRCIFSSFSINNHYSFASDFTGTHFSSIENPATDALGPHSYPEILDHVNIGALNEHNIDLI